MALCLVVAQRGRSRPNGWRWNPEYNLVGMAATMKKELGRRDRKKKETRRLILKCANALFHKQGYAATTLENIAAQAHVHKQTILRYFGSKEEIALAFRQLAIDQFKKGLLDPARKLSVLEYWRDFVKASATEVAQRGDMLRHSKLIESEPGLMAASLAIHIQYEDLLAQALSREAGLDPVDDIDSRLLAAFLVAGNFAIARELMNRNGLENYVSRALYVIDFAVRNFPRRASAKAGRRRG
jgi:AcrR family transcriptional regulator